MRQFNITVNGVAYSVAVEEVGAASAPVAAPVAASVVTPVAAPAPAAPAAAAPVAGGQKVNAPMPGTILEVRVTEGATVKKGDILLILEAMKMENEIMSPCDGTIKQVVAAKGASVNSGDPLIVIG